MVRGKVKSQRITTPGERKTSSVGKAVTVPSPAQSASKSVTKVKLTAPQAAAVPSCCNCGTVITEDVKALQCDRCNDIWKCRECLNFTGEVYDHLAADPHSVL